MNCWDALTEELARCSHPVNFWWRDDDAVAATPALDALLALQEEFTVPLYLAVIPKTLQPSLPERIRGLKDIWVLQHGYSHQNHAKPEQRNIELGGTQGEKLLRTKLVTGQSDLELAFQQQFLPVMVPPWNRLDDWVRQLLPEIGYQLLSTLGKLKDPPDAVQLNQAIPDFPVHIDIMDWQNQCYTGDEVLIGNIIRHLQKQRQQSAQPGQQPIIGLMTHHLVHDPACHHFLQRFFVYSQQQESMQWLGGDICRFVPPSPTPSPTRGAGAKNQI